MLSNNMPVTVRRSIEALGLCAVIALIVLGQDVFMPLLMAFFISLLLLPMFRWLTKRRVPEGLAIVMCLISFLLVLAGITAFLSYQIGMLVRDIGTIQKNMTIHLNNISDWINEKMHFTTEQQLAMIRKQAEGMGNNVSGLAQGAAVSLSGILIFVGLIPIYIFLIMYYRNMLLRFVFMWFRKEQFPLVESAARETEVIVKYYLFGLMIQIAYLTVLLGIILICFGIKHAILIAVCFAILNLIPYVGALVGNLIGVVLTLTSSQDLTQVWIVLGSIAIVQFLDNNILMPRIVGSRVKVNALVSIVGIVIGGTVAGISGMFLSIPIMAVLKIMFDKSDSLQQWGVLLGDDRPGRSVMQNSVFRLKKRLEKDRDKEVENAKDENKGKLPKD